MTQQCSLDSLVDVTETVISDQVSGRYLEQLDPVMRLSIVVVPVQLITDLKCSKDYKGLITDLFDFKINRTWSTEMTGQTGQ